MTDKGMAADLFDWRTYERIVAGLEGENAGLDFSVTPNAKLRGSLSNTLRQVDVLIDARWGDDLSDRIIVDAKRRQRKIDVTHVEAFEGMMRDCSARRGIIVCPNGYTVAALKRAQEAITIKLLSIDEAEEFDWSAFEPCLGNCDGLVLWDGQLPVGGGFGWAVIFTGKCDKCHQFHVWCWDCGERFALAVEGDHECGCERVWASAIEEQKLFSEKSEFVAVHLLMHDGEQLFALDRRALK
jgi:hypothetical protein